MASMHSLIGPNSRITSALDAIARALGTTIQAQAPCLPQPKLCAQPIKEAREARKEIRYSSSRVSSSSMSGMGCNQRLSGHRRQDQFAAELRGDPLFAVPPKGHKVLLQPI